MTECFMASQLERNPIKTHFSSEVPLGQGPRVGSISESKICILSEMERMVHLSSSAHAVLMICSPDISGEHSSRFFISQNRCFLSKEKDRKK